MDIQKQNSRYIEFIEIFNSLSYEQQQQIISHGIALAAENEQTAIALLAYLPINSPKS